MQKDTRVEINTFTLNMRSYIPRITGSMSCPCLVNSLSPCILLYAHVCVCACAFMPPCHVCAWQIQYYPAYYCMHMCVRVCTCVSEYAFMSPYPAHSRQIRYHPAHMYCCMHCIPRHPFILDIFFWRGWHLSTLASFYSRSFLC